MTHVNIDIFLVWRALLADIAIYHANGYFTRYTGDTTRNHRAGYRIHNRNEHSASNMQSMGWYYTQ
jgi:hypothetical protein